MSGRPPAARFSIGLITAMVWENVSGSNRVFYTVELTRAYKDGDEWKQTAGLMHADLLNASKVLARAEAWIADQQHQ